MKNLLELRDEIDVIDKQIVALYQQRMQIAGEVAEYKIETGKKVFDKDREMEKLATLSALGDSAFNRHGIRELFEQIMSISRKRQYQLMTEHGIYEKPDFEELDALNYKNARIVFQGTEGAYTQLALKQYFGEDAGNSYHVETWRDAMEAIASGDADYAVLPLGKHLIYATHGHHFGEDNPPPLCDGDVLLCGHTHVPKCADHGKYFYLNPGSVSIPKEDSAHGYIIWEGDTFTWKNLQGGESYRIWQVEA